MHRQGNYHDRCPRMADRYKPEGAGAQRLLPSEIGFPPFTLTASCPLAGLRLIFRASIGAQAVLLGPVPDQPGYRPCQDNQHHSNPRGGQPPTQPVRLIGVDGPSQRRDQQNTTKGEPFHGQGHGHGPPFLEPVIQHRHHWQPSAESRAHARQHECPVKLPQIIHLAEQNEAYAHNRQST